MKINEYTGLDEFIYEYDSGRRASTETQPRKFMGIEFLYRNVYYRMCYEPAESDVERRFYYVYIMHCESRGYPTADHFEVIGRYEKLHDLLNNFFIGGVPFKDVIMDDNTKILSKD